MLKIESQSPFGDIFRHCLDESSEIEKLKNFTDNNKKTVVVQGLGFVGAAMVAALLTAKGKDKKYLYNVIGVDLPDENNYWKIAMTNEYKPPVVSTDKSLLKAYKDAEKNKNLIATFSHYAYSQADIIIIDIHLDITKKKLGSVFDYDFTYKHYKKAIKAIADRIKENTLVLVETTVPPGTTEKVVFPIFRDTMEARGLDASKLYLAHSYERVMPGTKYFDSIVNFYRVFAGINEKSKIKARTFLESFINTVDFPLSELETTTASEMSKVLENSYRAMNIAFIKEWTEFAQTAGVNLFEVIEAIRTRPTHKNIMQPGFGVGGYCLTKDALLADWAYRNHYLHKGHLDMSINAISVNDLMPEYTLELIKKNINNLSNKKILILGVSYLSDVSDTRNSPTEYFYDLCVKEKAIVKIHDTIVSYWKEKKIHIDTSVKGIKTMNPDIAVFTVKHKEYAELDAGQIINLMPNISLLVDANNVINNKLAGNLTERGIKVIGVGKGTW